MSSGLWRTPTPSGVEPNRVSEGERAGRRICALAVNDWLPETQDLQLDRGMMGDEVIHLPGFGGEVERAGYAGPWEVEIFSACDWWRRDPREVVRITRKRYRSAV